MLTPEQELGIAFDAEHNGKTSEEYIAWRISQIADRGYLELQKARIANIQSKLIAEPSLIEEVSVIVDDKVAECVALKALAEEKLKEEVTLELG